MKASKSMIMKAVVAKCMDCCCGDRSEVRNCTITKCPLYVFRLGKTDVETDSNVKVSKRTISEEHKAALKAGREAAKNKKESKEI